jgi:hypothetical protein
MEKKKGGTGIPPHCHEERGAAIVRTIIAPWEIQVSFCYKKWRGDAI